jgi:hypothetical protein
LPATLVFDYPTVEALTGFLVQELSLVEAEAQPEAIPPVAEAGALRRLRQDNTLEEALTELEELSDEEAEALLLAELRKPRGGI